MTVTEALNARHSIRVYKDTPIEREKFNAIFAAAVRTPSWANSQPWDVFVAEGATLDRIKAGFLEQYAAAAPASPEVPRPKAWPEAALARQRGLHPDMVRDCGDAAMQFGEVNKNFFNAPAVIYICVDKILGEWALYDIGAYTQSVMLAAVEQGLDTIPAINVVIYPEVLRRELNIPDHLKVAIGLAIGYKDETHGLNNFNSSRSPLEETVRYFD